MIIRTSESGGTLDKQKVRRLLGKHKQESFEKAGHPVLCDKGGNVWLYDGDARPPCYNIWSNGRIANSITVPSARDRLISDWTGSVIAWTAAGIYHLTAEDPNDPANYTVKTLYNVDGLKGRVRRVEYSSPGYMVVSTSNSLYLIKLPEPEENEEKR